MTLHRRRTSVEQNFRALQETVYDELRSTQHRVRNLIGEAHWSTDGEHKEEILRSVLRLRIPESFRVGHGFVCLPAENKLSKHKSSGQIDILVTSTNDLTLYRQGLLTFVSAHNAHGIVEVKTNLSKKPSFTTRLPRPLNPLRPRSNTSNTISVIKKLSDQIQLVRENGNENCWAGLYVYDEGTTTSDEILYALQLAAHGDKNRAINCVSVGSRIFAHYWAHGTEEVNSPIRDGVWHSYDIHRLAPAYFVNNLAAHLSPDTSGEIQQMLFPIEGGKEMRRNYYAALDGNSVLEFRR